MLPLYTIFGSAGMRQYGIIVYDPLSVLLTWLRRIYLKDDVCWISSLWRRIKATAFLFSFPLELSLLVSSCYCCLVQLMGRLVLLQCLMTCLVLAIYLICLLVELSVQLLWLMTCLQSCFTLLSVCCAGCVCRLSRPALLVVVCIWCSCWTNLVLCIVYFLVWCSWFWFGAVVFCWMPFSLVLFICQLCYLLVFFVCKSYSSFV